VKLAAIINEHYENLNENDQHIAKYILEHEKECQKLSIVQLAQATLTSKSSVLRFTQKLGFSGYSEFKYSLKQSQNIINTAQSFVDMQQDDFEQTIKIFKQQNLQPILRSFDTAKAIYCYGTGWGQRDVLENFIRSMISMERFPIHLKSQKELNIALQQTICKEDLMIILSLSGENKPTKNILKTIKMKNVPLLSITRMGTNPLASSATYNLYFQATEIGEKDNEIFSMLSLFQIMDLFYRSYVDYKR